MNDTNQSPVSERQFLAVLSAPARRALEGKGITTLEVLATYSESDLLALHGLGPSSIPKLKQALEARGLTFNNSPNTSKRGQAADS